MTRAALYARYSSDLQSASSVEDQLALLRVEAAKRGLEIVAEYRDEALSGSSMHKREGLKSLLADAVAHRFDLVFSEALDRISRDQADTATIHKRLDFLGVRILTLSEGAVEVMHVGLKGTMNALFLTELANKTRRGLMGRVNMGRSAGGLTYGYTPLPGEDRGRLVIVEAEAAIVRRIFADYLAGKSARHIAADLNEEGVTGPRGGDWRASTINGQAHAGNGILNNELYIGRRIWNRRQKKRDPETGRARMFPRPQSEWKITEAPELRIIDDLTWQAVKQKQASIRRGYTRARRPTRLLSGLLQCGVCNGPFSLAGGASYGCSHAREKGTCTNRRTLSSKALEKRVIEGLKAALLHPDAMRTAAQEYHAEMQRLEKSEGGRRRELERDIAEKARRIERAVDAIVEGDAPRALKDRLALLEREQAELQAELAALPAESVVRLHPNADKAYAEHVANLAELMTDNDPEADELRQILRSLIVRIVLTPTRDGKAYSIDIKGDLAALLGGSVSGTVGAGARFGQTRNILPFRVSA